MVYKSSSIAPSGSSGGSGGGTVLSVTGLNTNNADPANPVVQISVDGVTITGAGTPGSPLVSTGGVGSVSSVFGRTGAISANYGDYSIGLISGVTPVSQGGTGAQTLSSHGVLLGEGTSAISAATTGIAARLLIDQGNVDPAFKAMSGAASINSAGVITLTNSSVTVSGVSGVTGGGTVALGSSITIGMAGNLANTLAGYNSSGVFSDVAIGSNLSLVGGTLISTTSPAAVTSVFSRAGAVVANYNDYQFTLIGGVASVSQGGTGVQTLSNHGVLLGQGTAAVAAATTGTAARILIDQGGVDPAFKTVTGDVSINSAGVTTIGSGAVSYAKLQTEAATTLLGNNTGSVAASAAISSLIIGATGYTASGYNFAQFTGNTNNYAQISVQNKSAGSSSSSDFVATANDGDDSSFYSNLGINGSVTGAPPFSNPHAAYLYVTSPELNIGAISAGGVINFYTTGGMTPLKAGFFDSAQNLNLTNALGVSQGGTGQKTFTNGQLLIGNTTTTGLTPSVLSAGTNISITNLPGVIGITATGSAGAVSSISTTDNSLTIAPNTGNVQANLNLAHANTWTATQTGAVSGGVTSFVSTGALEFSIFAIGNSGAGNPSIKWENGNIQSVTITGACTLGFTNPSHPTRLTVITTMSATSNFTYRYANTVKWPSGTVPTLSSVSNAVDITSFLFDGVNIYGLANTNFF